MIRKVLTAAAFVLLVGGCGAVVDEQARTPTTPIPALPATTAAPDPSSEHLTIKSIGVDTDLVPLGLTASGEHEVPPPDKSEVAGWFEPGPEPGQVGPAIILGHINGGGHDGVFAKLSTLKVGDEIQASRTTFKVYKVQHAPKNDFPKQAVYGETSKPELRLITCGGEFDHGTGHYKDNWVVFAA
jgi:sortase (surface protein transpeptidase)